MRKLREQHIDPEIYGQPTIRGPLFDEEEPALPENPINGPEKQKVKKVDPWKDSRGSERKDIIEK